MLHVNPLHLCAVCRQPPPQNYPNPGYALNATDRDAQLAMELEAGGRGAWPHVNQHYPQTVYVTGPAR
jgi:hypothetical protein